MRASSHFTASTSRRHGPALPIAWQHGRTSGTSPQPPAPPRVPHTEYRTPGPRRPGQHGPGQRESPPGRNLRGFQLVREGGVEPPRPFGHWNLNPARLPIPPPAHWVCRPSPTEWCERLPTCRRLARCQGWIHIPFPRPSRPAPPSPRPATAGPAPLPRPARGPRGSRSGTGRVPHSRPGTLHTFQTEPVHVSTSYRSCASPQEPGGPHSQVRDTGRGAPLRSMAGVVPGRVRRGASQGTSGGDFGRRRQPVDRADRGNQPISRRVDTISKQYQQGQQDQTGDSKLYQDGNEGGGAPWES